MHFVQAASTALVALAAAVASQDPRCGSGIGVCANNMCCSFAGYCNTTPAHCGTGCQKLFGRCTDTTPSPSPTPTADVRCGAVAGGAKCPNGLCCSFASWCGSTDAHCGANCQSPFGRCNGASPSPSPTAAADLRCGAAANGAKCPNDLCCSFASWCGSTDAHCGASCQSPFGRCNGASPSPSPTPAADARCGAAGKGTKCPNDLCCSSAGYCGNSDAHCRADTCQTPFGRCNPKPTAPRSDNRCGPNFGNAGCSNNQCCSTLGYCGKTTDHCDKFCNNIFGECIPPPTAGFPLPPVFSASNIPALAPSTAPCTRPSVRREFRTLTKTQRDNYIKAVKCLRTQPSKFPANLGTKSAYDDLVYVHMLIEKLGHMTAVFLPWHRVFSLNFESLLRGMCGYTDPLPYWDASIDSQAPEKSPVWAVDFMGGNGDASTGCVKTGPFAGNIVNVPKPHCLQRAFYRDPDYGSMLSALYTPTELAYAFSSATNYDTFRQLFESLIHNSVHTGVSGDMYSLNTSPNDPIFFLHHPNVDRLWWVWQNKFDKNRNQYGGMRSKTLDSASLTDRVPMFGLGQDFLIKDVLNTVGGGRFCYIYDNSAAPAVSSTSLAKIDLNDTPLPRGSPVVNTSSVPVVGSGSVTVAVQPLNGTASPGPFDRGDKHHLRHHAPIPDDFLRKMGHTAETIARVRANEAKLNKLVDMLNAETDKGRFLSQAALVITESGRVSFVAPSAGDAAKRQSALESLAAKALDELGPLAA